MGTFACILYASLTGPHVHQVVTEEGIIVKDRVSDKPLAVLTENAWEEYDESKTYTETGQTPTELLSPRRRLPCLLHFLSARSESVCMHSGHHSEKCAPLARCPSCSLNSCSCTCVAVATR